MELNRASVARNCWMRFSEGGEGRGESGLAVLAGAVDVGAGEENGVRCSDIGTMGKRAVQNVYFSKGVEVGKGESMMREVEWRVHYDKSLPPPLRGAAADEGDGVGSLAHRHKGRITN